jgi:hypothetical protein
LQKRTIAEILENEWSKEDYKPPHFKQNEDRRLEDVDSTFDSSEVIQAEYSLLVCSLLSQKSHGLKALLMLFYFSYLESSCGREKIFFDKENILISR